MSKALAVKYRPTTFDDVSEQTAIKLILTQQLASHETKHAYLFCGGAGTGKTTCARIFANEINEHKGNPIEMDAASNSSVEDVREIIQQARLRSLDSEYKVFIIDECHSLSNTAWQAMLKLIEEPPAKSVFIFCTTDPQKIPKTILSRVQRYDFQRISTKGIVMRLRKICEWESVLANTDALNYIAKLADGGMRDAITLLDKCIAYSPELTIENITEALGTVDYETMYTLTSALVYKNEASVIQIIESVHSSGKDLKQFIKQFMSYLLDVSIFKATNSTEFTTIPSLYQKDLETLAELTGIKDILGYVLKLNADIKWDNNPKVLIESTFIWRCHTS